MHIMKRVEMNAALLSEVGESLNNATAEDRASAACRGNAALVGLRETWPSTSSYEDSRLELKGFEVLIQYPVTAK